MSKPDKPGELRDVSVEAISLVHKAANGEKYKIFKSEEEPPTEVEKDERGLFRILKDFFSGSAVEKDVVAVEKGTVADIYNANESGRKLRTAFEALMNGLKLSRYDDNNSTAETDPVKIRTALDDFNRIAGEILLGREEVAKSEQMEIVKSGRRISGSRLSKLKNAHAVLSEVLTELDENTEEESNEVTKEEIVKTVDEAIKPLNERIEKLNVDEIVKNAIEPITKRLEKIESARGFSNRISEESSVKKSDDFWDGIF